MTTFYHLQEDKRFNLLILSFCALFTHQVKPAIVLSTIEPTLNLNWPVGTAQPIIPQGLKKCAHSGIPWQSSG